MLEPDDAAIVEAFHHYMGEEAFSYASMAINLSAKLENREFREDLDQLVVNMPPGYDIDEAANLFMERLGSHLDGAPALAGINGGRWRR